MTLSSSSLFVICISVRGFFEVEEQDCFLGHRLRSLVADRPHLPDHFVTPSHYSERIASVALAFVANPHLHQSHLSISGIRLLCLIYLLCFFAEPSPHPHLKIE